MYAFKNLLLLNFHCCRFRQTDNLLSVTVDDTKSHLCIISQNVRLLVVPITTWLHHDLSNANGTVFLKSTLLELGAVLNEKLQQGYFRKGQVHFANRMIKYAQDGRN